MEPMLILSLFLLPFLISDGATARTLTMYNKCNHTVWPGISSQPIARGGFKLPQAKSYTLHLLTDWSGQIWGRHGCSFDSTGRGRCVTGDCGGSLHCAGNSGIPPVTLAEITLGADRDFYDVSLVDGYNLAISLTSVDDFELGDCSYTGCVSDLNTICPVELQVKSHDKKQVVACKSACMAFNKPKYCCTGSYGNPTTCKPTAYSKIFKVACPNAYSYAYDDPTSIAICTGGNYLLTFCPQR